MKQAITIKVLQGDINDGIAGSCSLCPAALAIARKFNYRFRVCVSESVISLFDSRKIFPNQHLATQASLLEFINRFDEKLPVSPFAFDLEVEI